MTRRAAVLLALGVLAGVIALLRERAYELGFDAGLDARKEAVEQDREDDELVPMAAWPEPPPFQYERWGPLGGSSITFPNYPQWSWTTTTKEN